MQEKLNGLCDDVDATTHWYMRSSDQFRDFRKSLNDFRTSDLSNKDEVARHMTEIAQKATEYLKLKEDPNANVTERTTPRIQVAEKISDMFMRSVEKDKELKLAESFKEQEVNPDRVSLFDVNEGFREEFGKEENTVENAVPVEENGIKEMGKDEEMTDNKG
ncbi:MAG: hypothetical protein MJ072_03715 [Clostridia bacterium]|nr:hypothetical protein [Clostridia bacterium]